MPAFSEELALVQSHLHAGRLDQAELFCRHILANQPRHAAALHSLGLIAQRRGNAQVAIDLLEKASTLSPKSAQICGDLAFALLSAGRTTEAAKHFRRAFKVKSSQPEWHYGLGVALHRQNKIAEAIGCYERALALRPEFAEALNALGNGFQEQGLADKAIDAYQRAIGIRPDYVEAHHNLAGALMARGNYSAAAASYSRALELSPNLIESRSGLGTALLEQDDLDQAIDCFGRVLRVRPNHPQALCNLGNALARQARIDEALACYRRAIEIDSSFSLPYNNLLYFLNFHPHCDARTIYDEHRRWNEKYAADLAKALSRHPNDRSSHRKLRLGYVSPNFRDHCQSFFTLPLFAAHDREHFDITCYSWVTQPDQVTERLRTCADTWRDIAHLSDEQAAQLIRREQIDILIDLTMHMANARPLIFARKPAPVQVCWLAYPGTTGLSAMDYRITDPYLDPMDRPTDCYSETSIRLPHSFWCFEPPDHDVAVSALPATANGFVTFGSLNNFAKVNQDVLSLWAAVLRAIPDSRLLLLAPGGTTRQRTLETIGQWGVPADRISFVDRQPRREYLRLSQEIDIVLDTVPANGHTTTLDALWMGVPVLTLVGQTAIARGALSQLTNLNLARLAASSSEQFVSMARELSADREQLAALRAALRSRLEQSSLMNAPQFARDMEAAYGQMWEAYCRSNG